MRQFYWSFPQGSYLPAEMCEQNKGAAVRDQSPLDPKGAPPRSLSVGEPPLFPPLLSWTHYRLLITVSNGYSATLPQHWTIPSGHTPQPPCQSSTKLSCLAPASAGSASSTQGCMPSRWVG